MSTEFDNSTLSYLDKIKAASSLDYFVGLDVGASNVRIALTLGDSGDLVQIAKFPASNSQTLIQGVAAVGAKVLEIVGKSPKCAVAAIAGPVDLSGKEVQITNYTDVKVIRVVDLPNEFIPHATSVFINDLEGTCYGIESLGKEGTLSKYFALAWPPKADPAPTEAFLHPGNNLVLAAGTGLGTALLLPKSRGSPAHTVLPLEGGHTTVVTVTPKDAEGIEEHELLAYLSRKLYDGQHQIEFEDIVSGRGVLNAYNFFANKFGLPQTADILTVLDGLKTNGNPREAALSAFKYFFRILVRCAQTLTVATQSKCVFLAGDNQVANMEVMNMFSDHLKSEWEWHTKPQWVQPVSVWTQIQKYNLNLKGALYLASQCK